MTQDNAHWMYYDNQLLVPFVVADDGTLVATHWEHFATFFNNEFETICAGIEYWS